MTEVPPFEAPSDQLKPISDLSVIAGLLIGDTGASGTSTITPSLPIGEARERP